MKNEKEQSYHTIKKLRIGQTNIEVCIKKIPTEEQIGKHLTRIYDVINDIAFELEQQGVDTSDWFYTEEQVRELKKDPTKKFI